MYLRWTSFFIGTNIPCHNTTWWGHSNPISPNPLKETSSSSADNGIGSSLCSINNTLSAEQSIDTDGSITLPGVLDNEKYSGISCSEPIQSYTAAIFWLGLNARLTKPKSMWRTRTTTRGSSTIGSSNTLDKRVVWIFSTFLALFNSSLRACSLHSVFARSACRLSAYSPSCSSLSLALWCELALRSPRVSDSASGSPSSTEMDDVPLRHILRFRRTRVSLWSSKYDWREKSITLPSWEVEFVFTSPLKFANSQSMSNFHILIFLEGKTGSELPLECQKWYCSLTSIQTSSPLLWTVEQQQTFSGLPRNADSLTQIFAVYHRS